MNLDKTMIIPFLSKELDSIGYGELPYRLNPVRTKVKKKKSDDQIEEFSSDDNDFKPNVQIFFNNKEMITSLSSTCMDLVKQVKKFHDFNYKEEDVHKMIFDNQKLKRKVDKTEQEIKEANKKILNEKEKYRQATLKIEKLEKQIKDLNEEKKKHELGSKMSENMLRHDLRKKETDLTEVHNVLWKKFNMVDLDYLPKNFEIMKVGNPDFKKLWSDVKFSSGITKKEDILKSAICKYQENNEIMFEDNMILKSVLLATLEEINDVISLIKLKMGVKIKNLSNEEIFGMFKNVEGTNVDQYKLYLNQHLNFLKILFTVLGETKFKVGDDDFICWSDSLIKVESEMKKM